ncbi:hypothetical protein OG866_31490 [Streptomyces sp. NBC_00663]|uniref:hypothetical protein n=1 Tax=Streptomyces sp. NBC_00663 TaxID=2975801 RepID=UPI002E2FC197|nr:hypothetical protein [Streptomyces sp. NBC_00663]
MPLACSMTTLLFRGVAELVGQGAALAQLAVVFQRPAGGVRECLAQLQQPGAEGGTAGAEQHQGAQGVPADVQRQGGDPAVARAETGHGQMTGRRRLVAGRDARVDVSERLGGRLVREHRVPFGGAAGVRRAGACHRGSPRHGGDGVQGPSAGRHAGSVRPG